MLFNKRFIVKSGSCGYISSPDRHYFGSGVRTYYYVFDRENKTKIDVCQNYRNGENSEPFSFNKSYVKSWCKILNTVEDVETLHLITSRMLTETQSTTKENK